MKNNGQIHRSMARLSVRPSHWVFVLCIAPQSMGAALAGQRTRDTSNEKQNRPEFSSQKSLTLTACVDGRFQVSGGS